MSLLNDALRKNRTEQQPDLHAAAKTLFKSGRAQRCSKRYGRMAGCTVLLFFLAAGMIVWWQWPLTGATPRFSSSPASADPTEDPPSLPKAGFPAPAAAAIRPQSASPPTMASSATEMSDTQAPGAVDASSAPASEQSEDKAPPERPSAREIVSTPSSRPSSGPKQAWRPPPKTDIDLDAQPSRLPGPQVSSQALYQKARGYHRQARINEAIAMYREVLKIDPDHLEACVHLTSAYLQSAAFSQAYTIAAHAYGKAPANPQVVLNLAIAQIGCGREQQALALLDQAVVQPGVPLFEIYFHQGVAHRRLGQVDAAIACYQKAEQLKPDDMNLQFNLALALDQQQVYDQAVAYYQKYLSTANDIDSATLKKIKQRIRTLQAELPAPKSGEEQR